jgi:hypothetical protein
LFNPSRKYFSNNVARKLNRGAVVVTASFDNSKALGSYSAMSAVVCIAAAEVKKISKRATVTGYI